MGKNGFWTAVAIVGLGFLTFGVALAFMSPSAAERQSEPTPAKKADAQPAVAAAKEPDTPPGPPATEAPPARKRAPEPPPRPLVRELWKLPGDTKDEGKGTLDGCSIRELYFDPTGTRLVAVSPFGAHCLDIKLGKVVASVYPDIKLGVWPWHHQLVVSPDARFAAVPKEGGRDLDLFEMATGRCLRTYHPATERGHFDHDGGRIAFTANGEALIALVDCDGPTLNTFSTHSTAATALSLPGFKATSGNSFIYLPKQATLLHCHGYEGNTNPSTVAVLNLASGRETPLTAFTIPPSQWDDDYPLKLSPDGRRLAVKGREGKLQICDWKANRRTFLFERGGEYQNPAFTPDSQYLLVCWHNVLHGVGRGLQFSQYNPGVIELFELSTQEAVGKFVPTENKFPHGPTAVAVSPDGRTMAVATQRVVGLVDFEGAFGVKPRPTGRP
jgi:hypothetical protein